MRKSESNNNFVPCQSFQSLLKTLTYERSRLINYSISLVVISLLFKKIVELMNSNCLNNSRKC